MSPKSPRSPSSPKSATSPDTSPSSPPSTEASLIILKSSALLKDSISPAEPRFSLSSNSTSSSILSMSSKRFVLASVLFSAWLKSSKKSESSEFDSLSAFPSLPSKPLPAKRASSPISAIEISSGSAATSSSSTSSAGESSNIDKSGICTSEPSPSIITGFKIEDISGASKERSLSLSSFLSFAVLESPIKSDKSSSTNSLSTSPAISGMPSTNSSESSISAISLGIFTLTGFSPRLERTFNSSPIERRFWLNFLSWLKPGII